MENENFVLVTEFSVDNFQNKVNYLIGQDYRPLGQPFYGRVCNTDERGLNITPPMYPMNVLHLAMLKKDYSPIPDPLNPPEDN